MTGDPVLMHIAHMGDLAFGATTSDGHTIGIEPSAILGGSGMNPNPIDCLLAALGTCAGIKLLMTLGKVGREPEALKIAMRGQREKEPPEVFTHLHLTFFLEGDVDEGTVAAALESTMTLACPVAVMIGRATELTWDFQVERGKKKPHSA